MTEEEWEQLYERLRPKPNPWVDAVFITFSSLFVFIYAFALYDRIFS